MTIKISKVNCAFCGSNQRKIIDKEGEWNVVKCKNCNFKYTFPQPSPEFLPHFYTEEYYKDKRHYSKFYNEDGKPKTAIESYENRVQDIETFVSKRGKIIDVGSARGGLLKVLKNRGWQVQGVEISKDASKIANENGIPTFNGSFVEYQPKEKTDVICMYQTLEHVPDPLDVIKHAYNLLNDEGIFIAEIPNINCFEMKYNKERKILSYDLPRHLNHFSPKILKKQLENQGFTVIDIDRYPPPFILKILNRKNNLSQPKNTIAQQTETANKTVPIELSRKNRHGIKFAILRFICKIFPGWRFTITAQKQK